MRHCTLDPASIQSEVRVGIERIQILHHRVKQGHLLHHWPNIMVEICVFELRVVSFLKQYRINDLIIKPWVCLSNSRL